MATVGVPAGSKMAASRCEMQRHVKSPWCIISLLVMDYDILDTKRKNIQGCLFQIFKIFNERLINTETEKCFKNKIFFVCSKKIANCQFPKLGLNKSSIFDSINFNDCVKKQRFSLSILFKLLFF